MAQLVFKTSMHCDGCVKTVSAALQKIKGIENWKADLNNKNKLLIVEADASLESAIMQEVEAAGYRIELLKKGIFKRLFT